MTTGADPDPTPAERYLAAKVARPGISTRAPNELARVIALRDQRGQCMGPRLGWTCPLYLHHDGPCPASPAWWNLAARVRAAR
jgi:hypothetical protein